jgi:hypothetical protein
MSAALLLSRKKKLYSLSGVSSENNYICPMNLRLIFSLTAVGWLLAGSVLADQVASTDNPYTPIVTRNMFDLVPVPVGPAPDPTPATPPPKITPNGIMTIFGKLQALFKVAGVAKPGQPAKDESYILGEGERQDDIEVQKIDEKAAIITFNNHGKIEELPSVANWPPPSPIRLGYCLDRELSHRGATRLRLDLVGGLAGRATVAPALPLARRV